MAEEKQPIGSVLIVRCWLKSIRNFSRCNIGCMAPSPNLNPSGKQTLDFAWNLPATISGLMHDHVDMKSNHTGKTQAEIIH